VQTDVFSSEVSSPPTFAAPKKAKPQEDILGMFDDAPKSPPKQ
jgi:hypothetical protein